MPVSLCNEIGCRQTTAGKYCARHEREGDRVEGPRASPHARGYDKQWYKVSQGYLAAFPWCVDCQAQGRIERATEVHHKRKMKDAPELKYDWDNLEGLCKRCHAKRSARGE